MLERIAYEDVKQGDEGVGLELGREVGLQKNLKKTLLSGQQ